MHNEKTHNLYALPYIIRVIKARTRWAGHVARMGRKHRTHNTRCCYILSPFFTRETIVLTVRTTLQNITCTQLSSFSTIQKRMQNNSLIHTNSTAQKWCQFLKATSFQCIGFQSSRCNHPHNHRPYRKFYSS